MRLRAHVHICVSAGVKDCEETQMSVWSRSAPIFTLSYSPQGCQEVERRLLSTFAGSYFKGWYTGTKPSHWIPAEVNHSENYAARMGVYVKKTTIKYGAFYLSICQRMIWSFKNVTICCLIRSVLDEWLSKCSVIGCSVFWKKKKSSKI